MDRTVVKKYHKGTWKPYSVRMETLSWPFTQILQIKERESLSNTSYQVSLFTKLSWRPELVAAKLLWLQDLSVTSRAWKPHMYKSIFLLWEKFCNFHKKGLTKQIARAIPTLLLSYDSDFQALITEWKFYALFNTIFKCNCRDIIICTQTYCQKDLNIVLYHWALADISVVEAFILL